MSTINHKGVLVSYKDGEQLIDQLQATGELVWHQKCGNTVLREVVWSCDEGEV